MHIETPKKQVAKSDKEVFEFLTDIKNFETLMPDNIDKFEVLDENTFKFALKGMPEIILRLKEQNPHDTPPLETPNETTTTPHNPLTLPHET